MGQQWGTHPSPEDETPCLQVDCCKLAVKIWLCTRLSLSMWSNAEVGHIIYDNQALEELWWVWHLQTGSLHGLLLQLWYDDHRSVYWHV